MTTFHNIDAVARERGNPGWSPHQSGSASSHQTPPSRTQRSADAAFLQSSLLPHGSAAQVLFIDSVINKNVIYSLLLFT